MRRSCPFPRARHAAHERSALCTGSNQMPAAAPETEGAVLPLKCASVRA